MGKKVSGAQKRKKRKEKEKLALEMERLKLGPTKLWTGLVLHHKDVFVSHVISKLNRTDRYFFSKVNRESLDVLAVRRGRRIGIRLGCSRMFIHFDAGIGVESHALGREI